LVQRAENLDTSSYGLAEQIYSYIHTYTHISIYIYTRAYTPIYVHIGSLYHLKLAKTRPWATV